MKEILIKQIQLDKAEKEILEELRNLLRDSRLPDNVLFTRKFRADKFKKDLLKISTNISRCQTIIEILTDKMK